MKNIGKQLPLATKEDYLEIQGGMPKVEQRGKLKVVTHNYGEGGGMIVRSHIDQGTVVLETARGPRLFDANLLREFHGKPCETQSLRMAGEGYARIEKEI